MLKILKFDLYKVWHSIWFKVMIVLNVLLCSTWCLLLRYSTTILEDYMYTIRDTILVLILFAVFLGSMDYNSMFEKNLIETNKYLHVLSKIITIFLFTLAFFVVNFILTVFFNIFFGKGVLYNPYLTDELGNYLTDDFGKIPMCKYVGVNNWTLNSYLGFTGLRFLIFFGVGVGVYLFTALCRNRVVSLLVGVLAYTSSPLVFQGINVIFNSSIDFVSYSLFEATKFDMNQRGGYDTRFPHYLILAIVYVVVYIALAFLIPFFKTLKKGPHQTENDQSSDLLVVKNLTKKYGIKTVLSNCSLNVKKGGVYGVLGENGAGKSTLIKLICGLINANDGTIEFNSPQGKVRVGALIEKPGLYLEMTAAENLTAKAICCGYDYSKNHIDGLLKMVGLKDCEKKKVMGFSTGMKQRLGIALAIMGNPDVIVLDEPLNGLDIQGISDLRDLIENINKEYGTTFLISSHILEELIKVSTDIIIIKEGKVLRNISKEQMLLEKGDLPIDRYYLNVVNAN